jgi:hypothetical protein
MGGYSAAIIFGLTWAVGGAVAASERWWSARDRNCAGILIVDARDEEGLEDGGGVEEDMNDGKGKDGALAKISAGLQGIGIPRFDS